MNLRGLIAEAEAVRYLPEVHAERCVHTRVEVASCERCVAACPSLAWVLDDEQLSIDPSRCDGCGLCAAACPEGALTLGLEPLLRRRGERLHAFAACEKTDINEPDAVLPCVNAVSMEQLARWYAKGVRRFVVCSGDCGQCPRGSGESLATRVGLLNRVLALRGLPPLLIEALAAAQWGRALAATPAPDDGPRLSRRGFLRSVLAAATDQGSLPGEDPAWRPPGQHLPTASQPGATLYAPSIDPTRCNGCDACLRGCPHGALRLAATADAYVIAADACTGCGLCADLCDRGAVHVVTGAAAEADRIPLSAGRCRACGAAYHRPGEVDGTARLCHVCLQANHLQRLFQVL